MSTYIVKLHCGGPSYGGAMYGLSCLWQLKIHAFQPQKPVLILPDLLLTRSLFLSIIPFQPNQFLNFRLIFVLLFSTASSEAQPYEVNLFSLSRIPCSILVRSSS
jgi:hypothetical protein